MGIDCTVSANRLRMGFTYGTFRLAAECVSSTRDSQGLDEATREVTGSLPRRDNSFLGRVLHLHLHRELDGELLCKVRTNRFSESLRI